jgi:hypothetical protein
VAPDGAALRALKAAAVSAEWELCAGATDERGALDQIDLERPHALVVVGSFERLVGLVRERFPGMRIVADRDLPGVSAVAAAPGEVPHLHMGEPRPGGPVGR